MITPKIARGSVAQRQVDRREGRVRLGKTPAPHVTIIRRGGIRQGVLLELRECLRPVSYTHLRAHETKEEISYAV